ncbi:cilia- and flagella-associated protein 52-like isoform X1 [Columba livia]|uniref:cilia- and flagella-associated protein 52-like isoform X1 n=2 Tax=Columba livia TaxID=8932 RepID=UPI0031BB9114
MAAAKGDGAVGELELQAAIGFNGHVPCGLICHPDREHVLYPLGCTVVIQHLDTKKQSFLHGHTDNVSCVAVSRDGMYVASGQVTCIGFKADVILWDFPKQELLARLSLHEGKVEGLSFSPRGIYLVSLGGQDDGRVMVWDVSKREAVCGSPASPRSAGNANVVMCSSCRDEMFVTAGNFTIRVWELDTATKKIHPSECYAGQLRRITVCVQMTDDDGDFYLGTTSGDVLKVNTSSKVLTACGPQKKKLSMVSSSSVTPILSLSCSLLVTEGRATCGRTITKRILRLTLFLRCQFLVSRS